MTTADDRAEQRKERVREVIEEIREEARKARKPVEHNHKGPDPCPRCGGTP